MNMEKNVVKIAGKLQKFKEYKQLEAEYDNKKALDKVFEGREEDRKKYEEEQKLIDEAKKEFAKKKKDCKAVEDALQEEINGLILDAYIDENDPEKPFLSVSDTLDFPQIGSVTYSVENELNVDINPELKEKMIEEFIDADMIDMLDINEEALKKYSQKLFKEVGHHVNGVTSRPVVKTTIRKKG